MKRFLSIMLVVVMLLSTLMLTSCDPIGSVKGFVNKILGREDVDDGPRTTITLEEWLATNELTNYTIAMDEGGLKITISVADNLAQIEYFYEEYIDRTLIYDLDNQCSVTKSSIGWLGHKTLDLPDTEDIKMGETEPFTEDIFLELTYDEADGSYYVEQYSSIWRYYFEDGRLVYAVATPTTDIIAKTEIKNIGTTAIELPEYTIINDGKVDPSKAGADVRTTVTSEDILAILESRNLTASTAIGEFDELMGYALELTIKLAGNDLELIASLEEDETYKQYVTAIEGDFYSIEPYKDAYLATGMDMSVDDLNEAIAELDINEVIELLVYNEEGRYYEFEIEGFKLYFYFENGQLVQFVLVGDIGLGEESEVIVKISDVGTTKVDIPEYTIGDTPPVIID